MSLWIEKSIRVGQGPQRSVEASEKKKRGAKNIILSAVGEAIGQRKENYKKDILNERAAKIKDKMKCHHYHCRRRRHHHHHHHHHHHVAFKELVS